MPTNRQRPKSKLLATHLDRRQALKGMGVLAVAAPALVACSENGVAGGLGTGGALGSGGTAAGTGGALGTGGLVGTGGALGTGGIVGTGGALGSGGIIGSGGASGGTPGTGGHGGITGGAAGSAGGATATGGSPGTAGAGGAGGLASMFDKAATCTLTPTDPAGEGPFFIHEDEVMNDEDLIRSDMRDAQAGVELQLNLRVLDQTMGCNAPIAGAQIYVWHTNAIGYYSGFNNQNPDMPYSGSAERTPDNLDRFCRGVQITDDQGIVSFKSIFPGWYNGRAIHIHFVALRPGSGPATTSYRSSQYMIFTTQMYFEEAFSRNIHENYAPYNSRASGSAYEKYVKPETAVRPTSKMNGDVAVGFLNIITASTGSRR